MRHLLILPLFLLLISGVLSADIILLKDGQELKGVIVEDYHDRIVLSTEKGEICLLRSNIEKVKYDILEDNLVKLGALYRDKGDYKLALYYYETAYKLNPDMKQAQDGMQLITNTMFRKKESDLEKEVALRQDTEEKMGRPIVDKLAQIAPLQRKVKELRESVGISIEKIGSDIKVSNVLKKSPADKAEIKEGDVIISIWGKMIKYMPLNDAYDLFLRSKVNEIKVVILREKIAVLKRNHIFGTAEDMLGARLSMEFEGLTVTNVKPRGPFDNAEILEKDRITQLAGTSTRYMPLEAVYELIEGMKDNSLHLEIQREVTFWKR